MGWDLADAFAVWPRGRALHAACHYVFGVSIILKMAESSTLYSNV